MGGADYRRSGQNTGARGAERRTIRVGLDGKRRSTRGEKEKPQAEVCGRMGALVRVCLGQLRFKSGASLYTQAGAVFGQVLEFTVGLAAGTGFIVPAVTNGAFLRHSTTPYFNYWIILIIILPGFGNNMHSWGRELGQGDEDWVGAGVGTRRELDEVDGGGVKRG